MALQTSAATASPLQSVPVTLWLASRVASLARTLWGLTAGLLFLLAFPLAIVLAPLLWAVGKLRGEPDSD